MSFTTEIKQEITQNGVELPCCAVALLSAYMRLSGSLVRINGKMGFEFATDNEEIANFIVDLFNSYYGTDISELDVEDDRLNNSDRYTGTVFGEQATSILCDIGCLSYTEDGSLNVEYALDKYLVENECCKKAYIKGAFLGGGNITIPVHQNSKTGYHLEVSFPARITADNFLELLAYFNIDAKITERKDKFVVYIKSSEGIKDFLALLGLNKSVLQLTDIICQKEFISRINRQRNCDLGNLNKQMLASEKQIAAFEKIEKNLGIDKIDSQLAEALRARKEYPEDTLEELSKRLGITKSCLNHRLRKLMSIADKL